MIGPIAENGALGSNAQSEPFRDFCKAAIDRAKNRKILAARYIKAAENDYERMMSAKGKAIFGLYPGLMGVLSLDMTDDTA